MMSSIVRLEHFPIRWLHLIEKELLQIQTLEHVFVAKAVPALAKHALGALVLLLTACSAGEQVSKSSSGSTITLGAPGYISSAPVIRITPAGLGAVGAQTPYSSKSLQAALPDFSFDTVQTATGSEITWLLTAFKDGLQQAQFEPDRTRKTIARIHVVGQETAGPNGERLGMTYAETNGARLSCQPGHDEWTGMALCTSDGGRLTYIYAPQDYAGPDGALPPAKTLANSHLVRMIWSAAG